MNELEQILEDTELRAGAIARLLTLIERDSDIINRHRSIGDAGSYVQQYIDLREANLATLSRLLEAKGTIRAELHFTEQAA
ncbi:hypothetical protein [Spirosoma foliorum]|uniref:Uncharacterized protein n=1 Tax=Spirosoma foliorum TaxID=2710596 RepID=A0A7G5GZ16_9BACT|nr:hypothetical protein [Spirosoma foliorum]QMW04108.1 hypothetical protein H3H32_03895 [Spirosoma foliorum]